MIKTKNFIENLIPVNRIPKKPYIDICNDCSFLKIDLKNERINKLGYSCEDFHYQAGYKIVSIGCSYASGYALDSNHVFSEIIKEKIENYIGKKTVNFNLASGGKSNDYIARIISLAVPILKPNLLLVNFTHFARREHASLNKEILLNFIPGYFEDSNKEEYDLYFYLTNKKDDQINFLKNYKTIEMTCNINNVDFLYSHIQENEINKFENFQNYVGNLTRKDLAYDNQHPGNLSHQSLADSYWKKLLEKKLLEKYK